MDIKDYLKSIAKRDCEIQRMKEHLVFLKAMAVDGSSPKMDGIPHGSGMAASRVENYVCKAIDLEKDIKTREEEFEKDKRVINEVLETLPTSEHKTVISMRYFEHCSWKQIAEKMNYSQGWVFRVHGEALDQLRLRLEVVA